jgi:hypothetical protein
MNSAAAVIPVGEPVVHARIVKLRNAVVYGLRILLGLGFRVRNRNGKSDEQQREQDNLRSIHGFSPGFGPEIFEKD